MADDAAIRLMARAGWDPRLAVTFLDTVGGGGGEAGEDGASAYTIAVAEGFVGNEAAWLASLAGDDGADGEDGTDGGAGLIPRGAWSAEEVYVANDVVQYLGAAYIANKTSPFVDSFTDGSGFDVAATVGGTWTQDANGALCTVGGFTNDFWGLVGEVSYVGAPDGTSDQVAEIEIEGVEAAGAHFNILLGMATNRSSGWQVVFQNTSQFSIRLANITGVNSTSWQDGSDTNSGLNFRDGLAHQIKCVLTRGETTDEITVYEDGLLKKTFAGLTKKTGTKVGFASVMNSPIPPITLFKMPSDGFPVSDYDLLVKTIAPPITLSGTADTQGDVGDLGADDSYIYVKTVSGWHRVAISTF